MSFLLPYTLKQRFHIIHRYILYRLLIALLAITGMLVFLVWLIQSLHFVSLVIDHGLSLQVFIKLTSLLIPPYVAIILPITTFIVTLFIYHSMKRERELTVLESAGFSIFSLSIPGLSCAVIATCVGFFLNLWLVPLSYHAFRQYEFNIRNQIATYLLQEGVFTHISNNLTVYVRSRAQDGTLHSLLIEDDRKPEEHTTILATHGAVTLSHNVPHIILYNGSRQVLDRKIGHLNTLTFHEYILTLPKLHNTETRIPDVSELSLLELLYPDPHKISQRDLGKFKVEGWKRLTSPLTCLSFAFVGLVAVLQGHTPRQGHVIRPLIAILTVIGLLALNLFCQNLAGRNLVLLPIVPLISILPAVICAIILFVSQFFPLETGKTLLNHMTRLKINLKTDND
ncbi:MAG: LptF/LptG family permease [Acetobacter sp.]|nr:LptF/LptG family permease [Acetobacter sp.]